MQVKLITLLGFLLGLNITYAQDDFVDQAIAFCKNKGGSYVMGDMTLSGDKYCRQVTCKKTTSDRYEIPEGEKGPEANVEGTKTVCVAKSVIDGSFSSGMDGSSSSGSSGSGSISGSGSTRNPVEGGIYDENGNLIGSMSGGMSFGATSISINDQCFKKCVRKDGFLGIFGKRRVVKLDRKACQKCLSSTGRTAVGADGSVIGSVDLSGASISGGKGSRGGVSTGGAVIIGGNTGGGRSGSGGVIWGGGGNSGSGAGNCSYVYDPSECISGGISGGGSRSGRIIYDDGMDCVNCEGNWRSRSSSRGSTWSGIAELAGAILPPLAYYGVNAKWAGAYKAGQQAWAGAAATGFEQCQLMQTNYVQSTYQYIQNNELQDRNVLPPECNGYQLGGFAGGMGYMGNGFGGFGNPWGAAGYSPGFMAGMYGPYGMQNPYGNGMGMGFGIGMGMGNGMGMGMPGMGMGMGMPGMGMGNGMGLGFGLNIGTGMGMGNCIQAPCNMGNMGYNYWGNGGNYGMNPWGNGAGSYWNGAGGWGNQGGANFGNIQQSYMQNQQAYQQDLMLSQVGASMGNMWGNGYGMMGGGNYGYAPYAPGNIGGSLNVGWGFNF